MIAFEDRNVVAIVALQEPFSRAIPMFLGEQNDGVHSHGALPYGAPVSRDPQKRATNQNETCTVYHQYSYLLIRVSKSSLGILMLPISSILIEVMCLLL